MKNYCISLLLYLFTVSIAKGQEQISSEIDTSLSIFETIIYFDSDQSSLDSIDKNKLDSVIGLTLNLDTFLISVETHTDPEGSFEYNHSLSQDRLKTIDDYFSENHISSRNITSNFFGETRIIDQGNLGKNRRGVIKLMVPARLFPLKGRIFDLETRKPIQSEVSIKSFQFLYSPTFITDTSGNFVLMAPESDSILFTVLADEYFIETNVIKLRDVHKTINLNVPLQKLELGKHFISKHILFYGDRSLPLRSSKIVLGQIEKYLIRFPEICLEIQGHVNRPGDVITDTSAFTFQLSIARAMNVKQHLCSNWMINSKRLLSRGYGNAHMIIPQPVVEEEHQVNRRVEFVLKDCNEIGLMQDEFVEDFKKFELLLMDWKYDPEFEDDFLELLKFEWVIRFKEQVEKMLELGIQPSAFTFKEILEAYPELPR